MGWKVDGRGCKGEREEKTGLDKVSRQAVSQGSKDNERGVVLLSSPSGPCFFLSSLPFFPFLAAGQNEEKEGKCLRAGRRRGISILIAPSRSSVPKLVLNNSRALRGVLSSSFPFSLPAYLPGPRPSRTHFSSFHAEQWPACQLASSWEHPAVASSSCREQSKATAEHRP